MKPSIILATCLILFACAGRAQTDAGKRQYQALCTGCHGEDGGGGGHGPSILDLRRPRATSREAVRDLILKGIPDVGMPAFKMSTEQADAIAGFVMSLKQSGAGLRPAPGG